jgi:hypothetical protein
MTDLLTSLAETLERAGVPYAVIGGHAVNVWLEPRATGDVDVTIEAGTANHARLTQVLVDAGYRLTRAHGVDLPSGPDFVRFISADEVVVLELQAAKTPLQNDLIRRARRAENGLRIATPEDLLVLKLIANRPKDQIDILGLVKIPTLDWGYIERAATEWELTDRLRAFQGR